MAAAANRALRVLGASLVGLVAAAGLVATALYALVGTSVGTSILVPRVLEAVNGAILGEVELDSFRLRSHGAVELEGVRVRDPDGRVVIAADRALARVDVLLLRLRIAAVRIELERPRVVLAPTEDGGLGIARAFRPRHPSPEREEPAGQSSWTVRLDDLAIRDGSFELVDREGTPRVSASAVDVGGRAATSRAGSGAELKLTANVSAPVEEQLSVEAAASLRAGVARFSRLRASLGETSLDAVGEWDVAARAGRVAVRSFAVDAADLRRAVASSPLAGDVAGNLFAAASEGVATVAFDLAQRGASGRASGAAALRMSSPLALGFELDLAKLDPARVVAAAPDGDVTLHARGRLVGTRPEALAAAVELDAAPSRVRDARVGPLRLRGTAHGGVFDVASLDATLPGARVRGSGRWDLRGPIAGDVRLDASDLAAAARTVEQVARVRLPPLSGEARLSADVGGTARAPQARFDLAAGRVAVAGVRAIDLGLRGELGGTLQRPRARATGSAGELAVGAESFRKVDLAASIDDRAAEARVTATTLRIGPDPLTVTARGDLARDWRTVDLAALTIAWPGTEYALTAPAHLSFAPPKVDRLELANGPTRITLEGGLARVPGARRRAPPRTVADARVVVVGLPLATLPRELLPPSLGAGGTVAVNARASGPLSTPDVVAHVEAADGTVAGLSGLSVIADGTWSGAARRAEVTASVRRTAGGELELRADIPAALGKAPRKEPIALSLRARALPLDEAARLGHVPQAVEGSADLDVALEGSVGEPTLTARASLADVRYEGYGPYGLDVAIDVPGYSVKLDAAFSSDGDRALELDASVPFELARFLRDPAAGARDVLDAPLSGRVEAAELDLSRLAGDFGLPLDLAGRLRGGADLRGTLRRPRGSLGVDANGVAAYGYRDAALQLAILLADETTGVAGSIAIAGEEVLQASGFLGLPVEQLSARGIESSPMGLDLVVPGADLARTGGRVPLAGRIEGRVSATGTLSQPELALSLDGSDLRISGTPLGRLVAKGNAARNTLEADARLDATAGGTLTATLRSTLEISLAALRRGDLGSAPSELHIVADRLNLGVLPALLPGTVRSASGELGADLAGSGPLASLRPIGTMRVTNGRAAISEMGEWSDIEVDASLSADAFKVERLQAHRGKGTLDAKAEARGLAAISGPNAKPAEFTAELTTRSLTIPRSGQDLATVNLEARASGTFDAERLRGEVTVPRGTVVLPERAPASVQSLEKRDDIVIVGPFSRPPRPGGEPEKPSEPYHATVRLIVPNRFFVTSTNPRMNIELQADATFDVAGKTTAEGKVEVIRGYVEPIGGRNFTIERGRITFTGAEPKNAVLDVVARYENPAADVTVTISGTTTSPVVKMTSQPPMDEAQIAMLIATGRVELKAGSGGVGTLTGEEAGRAALGVVATQLFRNVIADKLPVDSVALSSSEIRAGKYVTDKIYVGYTRNLDAKPEQNENTNEVRVEYQISPRWTLESRYGDARTGGASLIWSKDY